jgi:CxxC-x17-CxxC domain-containing protein
VFKKIWPDVWSARMEYILNNTILALLECNNTTLLAINRLLADAKYRKSVVSRVTDPVTRAFWVNEFEKYDEKYRRESVAAIQNKIGQFMSASIVRNIVAQRTSTFDVREIMDNKKIFIVNLSKGRIGEDASRLLGGMLITKIQLSAMGRVDIPLEADRKDFFLYVDEFQNFATESFAGILSEARKYRLSLIMAHQYVKQLDEKVADAVFGNVGTIVSFRIGADDAEMLEKEYSPTFLVEDIVNLPKFHVYLKLMIDGMASQPFSAAALGPIDARTGSTAAVIASSRKNFAAPRAEVEERIRIWSNGLGEEDFVDALQDKTEAEARAIVASGQHVPMPIVRPLNPSTLEHAEPKKERENRLPPASEWFPAVCGRCGTETTVPFPPDGKRKIYCKDCYKFRHEDEVAATPAPAPVAVVPQAAVQGEAPVQTDAKRKRRRRKRSGGSSSYDSNRTENSAEHH